MASQAYIIHADPVGNSKGLGVRIYRKFWSIATNRSVNCPSRNFPVAIILCRGVTTEMKLGIILPHCSRLWPFSSQYMTFTCDCLNKCSDL